jgi:tetratricopeptide (TPR) repeat protein
MKKAVITGFFAFALTACGSSAPIATQNANNTNVSPPQNAESLVVSSHSTGKTGGANNSAQNDASKTQTESPMAKTVDVAEMTAAIEKAEKGYKAKPADPQAKDALAKAYFTRAFVLTKAAQYRAALGDFRKGLKLKPDDEDAGKMHDKILEIFAGMKREPPKEGEEPPPMPFKKG